MVQRESHSYTLGCRAGDVCPFVHDSTRLGTSELTSKPSTQLQQSRKSLAKGSNISSFSPLQSIQAGRQYVPPPVDSSRIMQRPTPRAQTDNPREFQIEQLRRRFSAVEKPEDASTAFIFNLTPSDPDFPFDMENLECVLHVPLSFPCEGKPHIDVKNKEMGRGYQINIERGFDLLVERSPQATLLGLMNALDKQLEALLTEQKAETIKILPNSNPIRYPQSKAPQHSLLLEPVEQPVKPSETYTQQQRRDAEARRQAETSQLTARLGRLPLFSKSLDGIAYNVPIQSRQHEDLPVPLQAVKAVKLYVPLLYPLQHCRIEIQGVSRDAAAKTERAFERKAKESSETTLMGHVNYLAQHMHAFATEPEPITEASKIEHGIQELAKLSLDDHQASSEPPLSSGDNDALSHIKLIPRPPEWTAIEGEESSGSECLDSCGSNDDFTDNEEESHTLQAISEGPERGISLSFPLLELHGIELLELISLYVSVKCERCKETMDVDNIRSGSARVESCKKCASILTISFRKELMHQHSVRAGYLDLDGCTVLDMQPR